MGGLLRSVIAAFGALLLCALVARGEELKVAQWTLLGPAGPVQSDAPYALQNTTNGQSIRYGSRDYGINLVWDQTNQKRATTLRRMNGTAGPLNFGERVAIRILNGGWLRYQEREYGINLVWSTTPVYEFEITGGPVGTSVPSATPVALYNTRHGDYVVYGERDYGINLRWYSDAVFAADYPPLPFPQDMRGPSREPGQILLRGLASKVEIFHGGTADELDWHIFFKMAPQMRRRLWTHLLEHGNGARRAHMIPTSGGYRFTPLVENDLSEIWTEWMVLDAYWYQASDDRFFSADVTDILGLDKSAWDYSVDVGRRQNHSGAAQVVGGARLSSQNNVMVYLQGPLVNDKEHVFRVEIHPLDSVAYALDPSGIPLGFDDAPGTKWPQDEVTWRVAAFTNSAEHRIGKADYLRKERTTTWYLAVPRNASLRGKQIDVKVVYRAFANHQSHASEATGRRQTSPTYSSYGVKSETHAIERRNGTPWLRVDIVMMERDQFGGMFQADYVVRIR